MAPTTHSTDSGRLVENIMHFARVLRATGLPIGPASVIDALRAIDVVGITNRQDFYWTLHAVFVNRPEQRALFDQAFHVFWRNPRLLERMMSLVLPEFRYPDQGGGDALTRRVSDALYPNQPQPKSQPTPPDVEVDARLTWSQQELLQNKDFEQMSSDEIAEAKAEVARMRLSLTDIPTRRFHPHHRGDRIDMRASMRAALRTGSQGIPLLKARRRRRPPSLVILCDISGSMTQYSRMLLHFAHTLTSDRDRVHSFVFGTRLTNVTRYLREKDVDLALERVSSAVQDWSGGTRIGECLREFNHAWSRRILGQGAVVLLITDGLDRDVGEGLDREAERLQRSSRRLIWLNPLLRYDGFEPRSLGMRALLPHVDELRSIHNLTSLRQLIQTLSQTLSHRQLRSGDWRRKFPALDKSA